jgi:hypothetical protein
MRKKEKQPMKMACLADFGPYERCNSTYCTILSFDNGRTAYVIGTVEKIYFKIITE